MLSELAKCVLFLFSWANVSLAIAYDSNALIDAAVPYLVSADLHTKLSRGDCSYVSSVQAPSIELRTQEVSTVLNDRDKLEFITFIKSTEYKVKLRRNQTILNDLFRGFSVGVDKKTACGMLWGVLVPTFLKAEKDWARARKN